MEGLQGLSWSWRKRDRECVADRESLQVANSSEGAILPRLELKLSLFESTSLNL
jgi:hypothetical protein